MADYGIVHVHRHQRNRQLAALPQPLDHACLVAGGITLFGKGGGGQGGYGGLVARTLGADRNGHVRRCPARSRLVAR